MRWTKWIEIRMLQLYSLKPLGWEIYNILGCRKWQQYQNNIILFVDQNIYKHIKEYRGVSNSPRET